MDPVPQFLGKNRVHHAMPLHAGFCPKGFRHDSDTEMAFTPGIRTGMAVVQAGFITHLKRERREGSAELC